MNPHPELSRRERDRLPGVGGGGSLGYERNGQALNGIVYGQKNSRRSFSYSRLAPGEYCYQVLRRMSFLRPVRTKMAIKYIRRLAKKYSSTPKKTANRLIEQLFKFGPIGISGGRIVYDWWEFGYYSRLNAPVCLLAWQHKCFICHQVILSEECVICCDSEWCKRMYKYYYEEGRQRPNLRRLGLRMTDMNGEMRFNFFLSEYLRRQANEQARS